MSLAQSSAIGKISELVKVPGSDRDKVDRVIYEALERYKANDEPALEVSDDVAAFTEAADVIRRRHDTLKDQSPGSGFYASDDLALLILTHAREHLLRRLYDYLCPHPLPKTQEQSLAILKGLALGLRHAGRDLEVAARALNAAGKPRDGLQAHLGSKAALAAADGLPE